MGHPFFLEMFMGELVIFGIIILLALACGYGIFISIRKLHLIKKGAEGDRTPWILLIVVCSLYLLFFIAGVVFIFILMASIAVNGM